MMNAIRMVWIISRHYNTDERMVPLVERIAHEIADKVQAEINIQTVLRDSPEIALKKAEEARTVLESWHSTYMKVREKIEQSGTDHRWEFDRKRLFELTNYMAKICVDLHDVATVLDQFHKFLGPELKDVTGDAEGIEKLVLQVEDLVGPLETVAFNIFSRQHKSTWETRMVEFRERVVEIETMTHRFIDTSFQKLRSAEGAFDLLQNFRHIQSRKSINEHMAAKFKDIMSAYLKELEGHIEIFNTCKENPPVYKNYPPTAGAINWARDLYMRAKQPVVKFHKADMLSTERGIEVKDKYVIFARSVDAYIKHHYQEWERHALHTATEGLRLPILGAIGRPHDKPMIEHEDGTLEMPQGPYHVNFSGNLKVLIRESKYLDRMGFEVPESALNVTLQESKYHQFVDQLNMMLRDHDDLHAKLTPVEQELLATQLRDVKDVLKTGFTPLNWNSQRIGHFIEACNNALNKFQNIVSQVHKSSVMIDEVIDAIQNSSVVLERDFGDQPVSIAELVDSTEMKRLHRLDALATKYQSICPLLIKIEELVAGTNGGDSVKMQGYYSYWERRIYNAITKMIVSSLVTLKGLLNLGDDPTYSRPPLFQIQAMLSGKDVAVSPSLIDVYKQLSKMVRRVVESSKQFMRWMHGTCKETEPVVQHEDEEPVTFSFFSDVMMNPHVLRMQVTLQQTIKRVFGDVNKHLETWRRYDTVNQLWNQKKRAALEKLADRSPPTAYFDTRLSQYLELSHTVQSQPETVDIQFMRVDCCAVMVGINIVANEWLVDYGHVLHTIGTRNLDRISAQMGQLMADLDTKPEDLTSLKFILQTIHTFVELNMQMELDMNDCVEQFRTLRLYGIVVEEEEQKVVDALEGRWKQMIIDSKTKDLRMVKVKENFRGVTKENVIDFSALCKVTLGEFYKSGPGAPGTNLDEGVVQVGVYQQKVIKMKKQAKEFMNAEGLFGLTLTIYPDLSKLGQEMEKLEQIYGLYGEYKEFEESMSSMLWKALDTNALQKGVELLEKSARKFPKELKALSTFQAVEARIIAFREGIPLIVALKNDAMKPRHWSSLMELTGIEFDMNPATFTLQKLISMELSRYGEGIGDIVVQAMQERKIEEELKKIEDIWKNHVFELAKYVKNGEDRGYILRSADEIKLELEDNMLNLQAMSASRFVASFADVVREWERKLNLVNECIDIWFVVQRKWQYLESIFIGAEDIRLQLPEEAKAFDTIDKTFRKTMEETHKEPNVVEACNHEGRFEALNALSERLDQCQKSLTDYLDTKRNAFPRFFFLSDDELLSVLGSSDPTSIQIHMLKLFDNVKTLTFGRGNRQIVGQGSSEGETYEYFTPSPVDGAVEIWMTAGEAEMKESLQQLHKIAVFDYAQNKRTHWLPMHIGMCVLAATQVWWTWEVEDVFMRVQQNGEKRAMKELEVKLNGQLIDLVVMVRDKLIKTTRKKVNTLLIIDLHARDIISMFVRDSILNEKEFAWESQLRYYWDKVADDAAIKQCTGEFRFGYEYMGLNGRLVITPLTDRCYMTITQALTFNMGTAPAGPAGTGKTETVKDLAKGLSMPCFVTNCGDGLDYKAMGNIFSGLIQAGAWGCFDEFNRINIEVLSVVSAQLRALTNALNYKRVTCDLGMGDITIRRTKDGFALAGVFITMNPGYAGRTALPDNLKALFRPVTMITPDLMQICQIWLFSEGFEAAIVLGKKMTVLYALAKGQLSRQFHYDWGLRALKSVLVMAGELKRAFLELPEDLVLMRALRDANMPKFVFEDVPLFIGLINDLFPGLDCPRVAYPALKNAIITDMTKYNFNCESEEVLEWQVDKIIQMYETILIRHTSMIVGPTGGSKTVVMDTLQHAMMPAFDIKIVQYRINPKAQTTNELYGVMDPVSRDWQDGVLSKIFRDLNSPLPAGKENEIRWIIYDGDVDALWIENMNSVMDDNKLLTLPNGERIRLQDHCKMIMEVFDLQYASPATVSRCGMVWVDPKNLGFRPYYEKWQKERRMGKASEEETTWLRELFDHYIEACVDYILFGVVDGEVGIKLNQIIPINSINMIKQLCCSIDTFWPDLKEEGDRSDLEGIFVFSIIWSLGASLVTEDQPKFDNFVKGLAEIQMPSKSLYLNYFDLEQSSWEEWAGQVPDYVQPQPFAFYNIIVPTTDSVLYSYMIAKMIDTEKPLLYIGESGTAKTTVIQDYLDHLDDSKFNSLNINFSSNTSSWDVQQNVEANTDKRTGNIYGPSVGKKLVVFIDDMNMPKVDTYGTQQPIALLHLLVGKGAMYDRSKDLALHLLKDLRFIGAMGPPGGGRNPVDPRFVALFNVYNLNLPSEEVLQNIYTNILSHYFHKDIFEESVVNAALKIPDIMLAVFHHIVEKLPPTPTKFHYIFNLRDLGRVCEGLCKTTIDFMDSSAKFARTFRNEMNRVFMDRLTTEADLTFVGGELEENMKTGFSDVMDEVMKTPIIFGDFEVCVARLVEEAEDPRVYQDMNDYVHIRKICDEVLEAFNVEHKPMTLVLFESALEHLTRISRILSVPRGNALLVGVGGSGKQSLTKLSAFMSGMGVFQITLARGYGDAEFREDLKELYNQLVDGPMVFLFTDAHVKEEGFLENINNMLTTGMVPALYENDEMDQIRNKVRSEATKAGVSGTPASLWNYYVSKARDNLHCVLSMSPSGDNLRVRCRNFPGMISACVIDWFFPWPQDALTKVADFFLSEDSLPDEHRHNIEAHLVMVHQSVLHYADKFVSELRRYYYISPKNYLDLISNYRTLLREERVNVEQQIGRLGGGLTKLIEAAEAVARMEIELKAKSIVVDAATIKVEAMIKEIAAKTEVATEKQESAAIKQVEVEEKSAVIVVEKAAADEALAEALPAVQAAADALENLDKKDLVEIKAFAQPPPLVKAVCMQVLALNPTKQKLDPDWKGAKQMIGNSNLLNLLKEYQKDSITERQMKKVRAEFKDPGLTVDNMGNVSKAGQGLLIWVVAIVKYHDVAKQVEPLKNKVRRMEKEQAEAEKSLADLNVLLESLNSELSTLNHDFTESNDKLMALKEEADLMQKRLEAAAKLIKGLASERERWGEDVKELNKDMVLLLGDCLLAASFLSYAGAFTFEYRMDMIYEHFAKDVAERKLPFSSPYKLEKLLTTDARVQLWTAQGLPSDENSVQNGILTTKSSRFPLCIDPQEQAVAWIKNRERDSNLVVKAMSASDFMKHLELAVQFGNPFLFEAIDEDLDPMIDPIVEKNIVTQGAQKFVKLGDKNVEWDDNFRLYFTTKLPNPHYSPEIMGKVMIINYSVTQDGLSNQLLNVVVKHERPDLEESFSSLVKEMGENADILAQLEDTLLKELSSSEGNILDNSELIATLANTKTKATDISAKMEQASFTKSEIVKARQVYIPCAMRGSIIFFAMGGLPGLFDHMSGITYKIYEVSLESYLKVFVYSLDQAKKHVNLDTRLDYMNKSLTENFYDYTCTGIFEKHKLMFSFQLCSMIMDNAGTLDRRELDFFLKGDTSIEAATSAKPESAHWLSDGGWKDILCLTKLKEEVSRLNTELEQVNAHPQPNSRICLPIIPETKQHTQPRNKQINAMNKQTRNDHPSLRTENER
jgi:dynein heavy chain